MSWIFYSIFANFEFFSLNNPFDAVLKMCVYACVCGVFAYISVQAAMAALGPAPKGTKVC
jgi:hypothetical protein